MNDNEKREEAIKMIERLLKEIKMSMVLGYDCEILKDPLPMGRISHTFTIEYVRV